MSQADSVKLLIKKHFWDMAEEKSLNTGNEPVLPEEAADFFEEYFATLAIDPVGFNFRTYFPNAGLRFLPNAILPNYLKTDPCLPQPLTVQMLMTSAEAGRWLYGVEGVRVQRAITRFFNHAGLVSSYKLPTDGYAGIRKIYLPLPKGPEEEVLRRYVSCPDFR